MSTLFLHLDIIDENFLAAPVPLIISQCAPLVQRVISTGRSELGQVVILPHQAIERQVSCLIVRKYLVSWHRATLLGAVLEPQPLVHLTDFLESFVPLV